MNAKNPSTTVDTLEAFPAEVYEGLDLAGLAVYAIDRLQNLTVPVTFENLVVGLFRLFPTKFALEGYDQYPDAARVGRTLLQLGPKYRNWARGSVQKGFTLTQSGTAKVKKVAETLMSGQPTALIVKRQQRPRTMDLNKELAPVENSPLFQAWKKNNLGQAASKHEAATEIIDMLGAYVYLPPEALKRRVIDLQMAAKQVGRENVADFLEAVLREFASMFTN